LGYVKVVPNRVVRTLTHDLEAAMTTHNDQILQQQDLEIEKFKTRIAYGVAVTWTFGILFVYAGIVFAQKISSATIATTSLVAMLLFATCGVASAVTTASLTVHYLDLLVRRYRPIVLDRSDLLVRPEE